MASSQHSQIILLEDPSYLSGDGTSPGKGDGLASSDILGPASESKRVGGETQGNERSRHGEDTREMHLDKKSECSWGDVNESVVLVGV